MADDGSNGPRETGGNGGLATGIAALEDRIDIDAPAAVVWDLVSDLGRMAEWSPQVESTRLAEGYSGYVSGARFTNLNRHGELTWVTHGEVVDHEPGTLVSFRIAENWVVWSFRLQPSANGGTTLVQRRDAPDGISPRSRELADRHLGGQAPFTVGMTAGMRLTLKRIKAAAEAVAATAPVASHDCS